MANLNLLFEKYQKEIIILISIIAFSLFVKLFFLKNTTPDIAFYHWKTNLALTEEEENILIAHKQSPLYIHLLDLVWDEERMIPIPTAQLQVKNPLPEGITIVPVVYITNEVFEKIPDDAIEIIAEKLTERITEKLYAPDGSSPTIESLQIDCDWTLKTKDKYFKFLEALNTSFSFPLSATIRLHQIKYFDKTGVPPVKRGMLMFYNMGDLDDPTTQNSILDLEKAKSYMVNFDKYPLELDVALPLFQWGVILRDGKTVHLSNALTDSDLIDSLSYRKLDSNRYQVLESTYLKSYYCYEGDEIRLEKASISQLKEAVNLLSKHLKKEKRRLCFYHLDNEILKHFPDQTLKELQEEF
jgi:hypothetical protein